MRARTGRASWVAGSAAALGLAALALVLSGRSREGAGPAVSPPSFVGGARCAACHPGEAEAYRGSDHARAMAPPSEATVRGDFDGARFAHGGVVSTFVRRDGKYVVRTDGPDGEPGEFEIAYTFGVTPLQQYLIPLAGGRLQALGIAWDARPRAEGGQRWFHLYPGETLRPPDPLHWTGREQTWNHQCAECHSTNLRKNYDPAANRYGTTWTEIAVSCEACHGPGSAHVAWAERRPGDAARAAPGTTGLVVRLGQGPGAWVIEDPARGLAAWSGPPRSTAEVDACARCHARRRAIVDPYPWGRPFLDTHAPALLDAGLYHPDGQILGEVYEYGSFVQSRMHRAGVVCSDCHEPHRLALRAAGNAVCARCHAPARFDVPEHHHHRPGSEAARCVACHMPARTYMEVDPRRDHSFRVPRPDLSTTLGTPNACSGCHRDRPPAWAAEQVVRWHGPASPARRPHFGAALEAGRRGLVEAPRALAGLAGDAAQPAIARATALAMLPGFGGLDALAAVVAALPDRDPLVRAHALAALEMVGLPERAPLGAPGLRDPVRAVRLAAARALAGAPSDRLTAEQRRDLERALAELVASEMVNADRPDARVSLSNLYTRLGRPADAEAELRAALVLDPRFVPALVNLADLYRSLGREADGERALAEALRVAPDSPEALHALGLLRVRQGRRGEALELLGRAARRQPDSARLAFVYAVALHDQGEVPRAIRVLEDAHRRRPADRAVLGALVQYLNDQGEVARAARYAERLAR